MCDDWQRAGGFGLIIFWIKLDSCDLCVLCMKQSMDIRNILVDESYRICKLTNFFKDWCQKLTF